MIKYLDKFSLKNKFVFIAGGAGLIGAEACRACASVGAKILILDSDVSKARVLVKEILDAGGKAYFEKFNMADLKELDSRMEELTVKYGVPNVWVNATYPRSKDWVRPLEKITVNYVRENVDIHFNSYLLSSRKIAMLMKKHRVAGSIINFGSIYGVQASDFTVYEGTDLTMPMAYAAIKAGIVNSSRYLASYFGKDGIRFNTICPGGVKDNQPSAFVKKYEHKVPLKRMAVKEEIPMSVVFLASKASSYITGETLMVDGGWTVV